MADFDFSLMPTLEALLREKSVTAAARRLGRSQPAISRELALLRRQLGDQILLRTNAGAELTPRARDMAQTFFGAMDDLRRATRGGPTFAPAAATNTFRISIGDYEGAMLLPAVLARLTAETPGARLSILHRRRPDAEQALNTGEIDLAIGRFVRPGPLLFSQSLFDDDFSLCAHADHPEPEALQDVTRLVRWPFVLISPGGGGDFTGLFDTRLEAAGLTRQVRVSAPHFLLLPQLLSNVSMVALTPTRLARLLSRTHPLQVLPAPLAPDRFEVSMLWHQRTERDAAASWLRAAFADAAAALRPATDVPSPGV